MKITIEEIPMEQDEELILRCHSLEPEVMRLLQEIKNAGSGIAGYKGETIQRLSLRDIFYFEVVDGKSFLYCKDEVFESKLKLYEFEELARGTKFFRASKSMMLNSDRIKSITPTFSGRFEVHLTNGESVVVSRQYVNDLKKILGI